MWAVIVNTLAIVAGSLIGLMLRRGIPKGVADALMKGLGLCTIIIGLQGAVKEENILLLIVATTTGIFIGEATDLDGKVNRATEQILQKFNHGTGDTGKIAQAFVTSCLIMNVGAMVIVGSLNAGLVEDYNMLYTKSLLDFVSGIMLTTTMGIGVMGSAGFTLAFQGGIVLLAEYIAPLVSDTVIAELNTAGCLLIFAIGLNLVELTKLKVINYLPTLIMVPILIFVCQLLE
ncbi:MAG: DUF554 domain-containing protein [Selenomonadaceae bacterium]|nr:DUF554 domain-containing protein [Selenomonadaceae bacterium]